MTRDSTSRQLPNRNENVSSVQSLSRVCRSTQKHVHKKKKKERNMYIDDISSNIYHSQRLETT